jgi:SRSO17 transposase
MVKHSVEHRERGGQQRLDAYLTELARALGHADREDPFRSYCFGLLLDGERKSVEPMAARLDPERVQAKHQSLHHFVAQAAWSDTALLVLQPGPFEKTNDIKDLHEKTRPR